MTPPSTIRIGISREPAQREDASVHWMIEHRTIAIDELVTLIQNGHALGAITRGQHVYENFAGRQDLQLDIDADISDPLAYYAAHPFVKKYCYLIYTTRTPGHCRLVFRISKQITNPVQYARYAGALATMFGADKNATSPAQLWYTYAGCDVAIIGETLPLRELESLERTHNDAEDYQSPSQLADPEALLRQACDSVEGRNVAGFNLALSLRKLNMPIELSERYMKRYQSIVGSRGTHAYTVDEALNSLGSAYRHKKYSDMAIIEQAREAIVTGVVTLPANVRRTARAVLDAMQMIGRTVNIELSIKQIARAAGDHIAPRTVYDHLKVIQSSGLLRTSKNGNGRLEHTLLSHVLTRAFRTQQTGYHETEAAEAEEGESRAAAPSAETPFVPYPVCCVRKARVTADVFGELQHSSATESHAKVHPLLATTEADYLIRLGSGAQMIISVLAASEGGTVNGIDTLQELCCLSWRVVSKTVQSLQLVGLVEVTQVHRTKSVTLLPGWRGMLRDFEPLLTTYGRDVLRAEQSLRQRQAYHQHIADNAGSDEVRAKHDALVTRADAEMNIVEIRKQASVDERRAAAQNVGLAPDSAPPISLSEGRKQRKQRQPVVEFKSGEFITRHLIPDESRVAIGKNNLTKQEKREHAIERLYLGHVSEPTFGTTEVLAQ